MVHIPTILPGITIKPAVGNKSIPSSLQGIPIKQSIVKPVKQNAAQKANMILNPFVNKLKNNSVSISRTGSTVVFRKEIGKPSQNKDRHGINPMSINKSSLVNQAKKGVKPMALKKSLLIKGPQVLNFLPSGITVTKAPTSKPKPKNLPSISGQPNQNLNKILKEKEMLTVNLDDEEPIESTPSPQWYLRPEQESNNQDDLDGSNDDTTGDLEEQNNKEPEVKKYVEITIEDSPMKSMEDKQRDDIGREIPIVIEDSPCKIKSNKEENHEDKEKSIPQSKKKLNYPNNKDTGQIVEIEIDAIATTSIKKSENEEESKETENETLPKNKLELSKHNNEIDTKLNCKVEEFHSIYQEFIDTCFKLENSEDMKKIVEKKIKTYYKQCPKEYVESEEFIDIVSSKIMAMKAGPDKLYLYIKDVVDELNLQRKMAKSHEMKKEIVPTGNIYY